MVRDGNVSDRFESFMWYGMVMSVIGLNLLCIHNQHKLSTIKALRLTNYDLQSFLQSSSDGKEA